MIGQLPQSITVNGVSYAIRTDYRDILRILVAYNDPNLEPKEQAYICLVILYVNFVSVMPKEDYNEALEKAIAFIDMGSRDSKPAHHPKTMDWEQDESILFPAINKVAGFETRSAEYIHWWTFMGYFMEISDGVFSQVLSLRMKKAKGKKLEKHERDFWTANRSICVLQKKVSDQQREEMERLKKMLG